MEEAKFRESVTLSGDNAGFYYFKDLNMEYDSVVYALTDYSYENQCGTLKKFSGGESEKVADDVSAYRVYEGGSVVYLRDFNQKRVKGDLYLWKDNKKEKIDEDVTYFSGQRYVLY